MATVVFGCVASALALLTLITMLWLGLRRPAPTNNHDTELLLQEAANRSHDDDAQEGWGEPDDTGTTNPTEEVMREAGQQRRME